MKWMLSFALLAGPAMAETCPAATDHSERLAQIVVELQAARGAGEARILTEELWTLWTDAPDEKAQSLLDRGMAQRARYDFAGAYTTLNALVDYCPDFVEGYNQRAFASYLRRDFPAALADLDRAIEMMPNHIAAISGRGLTLMGLGRHDEAQDALKEAVGLNPWLSERSLIVEPIGTDI